MAGLKLTLQLVALIALMLCAIGAAHFSISGMADQIDLFEGGPA
jgi:hypothetical protein